MFSKLGLENKAGLPTASREAAKMMEYEYAAVLRDQIIELRGTK